MKLSKLRAVCIFAIILFIILSARVAADNLINQCEKMYISSIYDAAYLFCRASAQEGNTTAMLILAELYHNGEGTSQDYIKSYIWTKSAVDFGDKRGFGNLGLYYKNGLGVIRNDIKAYEYLLLASQNGDVLAQANLGKMYAEGIGTDQDFLRAQFWWTESSKQGNSAAQFNLGLLYIKDDFVYKSDEKAIMWILISASGGYEDAERLVAYFQKSLTQSQFLAGVQNARECVETDYVNCN